MKIENIEVYGFRRALFGMRNPMNSWEKSDSKFVQYVDPGEGIWYSYIPETETPICCMEGPIIGPEDMRLAKKLIKGGSEHRKFLRQIEVCWDITIPRYIWQELDTYKVATVRNSCSTMHKLSSRDLEQCDFELPIPEEWLAEINRRGEHIRNLKVMKAPSKEVNAALRDMKNILPEGFLQRATYSFNYETGLSMYFQRRNHRMPEWNEKNEGSICWTLLKLPYMSEFVGAAKKEK